MLIKGVDAGKLGLSKCLVDLWVYCWGVDLIRWTVVCEKYNGGREYVGFLYGSVFKWENYLVVESDIYVMDDILKYNNTI